MARKRKPVEEVVEAQKAEQPVEQPATQTADQPATEFLAPRHELPVADAPYTPPTTATDGPSTLRAREDRPERPVPHIANPSSVRRESHVESVTRRLPDKMTVTAGDLRVQLIDAGRNEMGVGIRVAMPEGRRLTEEEKAIIREHMKPINGRPGLTWDQNAGIWHAAIVFPGESLRDVPQMRPVAVRLEVERRIESLAEALREHIADPVGYAEMVRERRERDSQEVKF